MRTNNGEKKQPCDWHPADIGAALKKAGTNMRALSKAHGYEGDGLRNALYRPYPKAERIIAGAIGVLPEDIWPSRY